MKAAAVYAQRFGWRLVPLHDVTSGACSCRRVECPSAGKHPRTNAWQKEASSDPEVIADWASRWPRANLGVATGEGSGFFVVDVDPENGGVETLTALEAIHGALPVTVTQRTGSGGAHYLFNLPPFPITNTAGKLGAGLDTRGNGGQIVVAPSVSAKGKYRWVHPPWSTPIAAAPPWLLTMLAAPAPKHQAGASSTDRGYFPPASAKVLEAARAALELHGPAIDGNGGGLHSVRAGMILAHDFALTDDEAFPLLEEWNATCVPPWDPDGLAGVLERGRKYGKADYGARRSMDAVATAEKVIADWQASPDPAETMFETIDRVREIAVISGDSAKRGVIERTLVAATGLGARALALPQPAAEREPLPPGTILVNTLIHETANASIKAIAPAVFVRNGVLCEVVKARNSQTFISDLETPRIQDLMSQAAKFVRYDEKLGTVDQVAPLAVAQLLHSRRTHPEVRVLEAITTAPVFLADGSILQTRGYNAQARVFLEPSVSVDVPDNATLEDAQAAVALLSALVGDFNFATPADLSSWLAGLLSPLVKAATSNAPSPLICVSASSRGAGKTLLTDVIARIVTGAGVEVRPYTARDASEWGKKLTAFVKAASPVSVFDNCNGALGDDGLDRLITSSTWSDRILGASDAPPLPNVTTWFATGNNIEPVGDTVRRVLVVRLDVTDERPQERTGFAHPLLAEHATEHRSEFLSAALTILRAYHLAGRPPQDLPAWGSFTAWSDLIRGALVWAGCADPFLTQRRASADLNEPENEAHDFWLTVVDESDGLVSSIVNLANKHDAQAVLGARAPISAFVLKGFLSRFVDKPRRGLRIRKDPGAQTRYFVETIS